MTASELAGWMKYFSIYPFKMVREYEQSAMIAQTVVNSIKSLLAQNAGKKTFKPVGIDVFLPEFLKEKSKKATSIEQQHNDWSAFVADAKSKGIA